jgi:hypothetical protein
LPATATADGSLVNGPGIAVAGKTGSYKPATPSSAIGDNGCATDAEAP